MTDSSSQHEVIVVGSGPNGLAAAIEMARAGYSVVVLEQAGTIGGGTRSGEATLPGYVHDLCSAVHPFGLGSPYFATLPLSDFGLDWVHPPTPLAHPMDDGTAVLLEREIESTCDSLSLDQHEYRLLMEPLVNEWQGLAIDVLAPAHVPRRPVLLANFALRAMVSADSLAGMFTGERARALIAGLSAHSFLPLNVRPSAAFGIVLGMMAHAVGWPIARRGSQKISNALAAYLITLGGKIETNTIVRSLDELPEAKAVFLDVTPRQLLQIAGDKLGKWYSNRLKRYKYGPGVFKIDWALSEPIPWTAKSCLRACTVHVGGAIEDIAASEKMVHKGGHPERPFVLLAQQTLFDATRAPAGKHTAWAYCHVPNNSNADMTEAIERQIARFAPGFRDIILARHTRTATQMEAYNPNYIGGDINGGLQNLRQLLARPVAKRVPYKTDIPGVYLCSSSTPPGGGVHGMCGYHAARVALKDLKREPTPLQYRQIEL